MWKEMREPYGRNASGRGWEDLWRLPKCDPVMSALESNNSRVERAAAAAV